MQRGIFDRTVYEFEDLTHQNAKDILNQNKKTQ